MLFRSSTTQRPCSLLASEPGLRLPTQHSYNDTARPLAGVPDAPSVPFLSTSTLPSFINIPEQPFAEGLGTFIEGPLTRPPKNKGRSVIDWKLCHCGQKCRGRVGLHAHQRRCRTVDALLDADPNINREAYNCEEVPLGISPTIQASPARLTLFLQRVESINLPHSAERWAEAQAYFKAYPPLAARLDDLDLDDCATSFQQTIYNYFHQECSKHRPYQPIAPPSNAAIRSARKSLLALKAKDTPIANIINMPVRR